MNQIERIRLMEEKMEEAAALLSNAREAPETLALGRPLFEALAAYLHSPQWLADYAADEEGLLPPTLKRGVLSQDGLYNLLMEYEALKPFLPQKP